MKKVLFLGAALGLMISCGSTTAPDPPSAHFVLVSQSQSMTNYGCPQVLGTVKNDGNGAGYNVMITFQAYNSSNTIIDTANGFPGDLGTISAGVSAAFDAVFFELSSWTQIARTTYEIEWLDRSGVTHSQTGRVF